MKTPEKLAKEYRREIDIMPQALKQHITFGDVAEQAWLNGFNEGRKVMNPIDDDDIVQGDSELEDEEKEASILLGGLRTAIEEGLGIEFLIAVLKQVGKKNRPDMQLVVNEVLKELRI